MKRGEIVPVDITLLSNATRFRKAIFCVLSCADGGTIREILSEGRFPSDIKKSSKGTCAVHTGGLFDSSLFFGHRSDVAS